MGNARYFWFDRQPRATVYLPAQQAPRRWIRVVLRTQGDPLSVAAAARTHIAGLDPEQAVADIMTMEGILHDRLIGIRLSAVLMGVFGVIALLMAAVGIYGVIAYAVARRTHEIGIRMAIGAKQRDVLVMVVGQALILAGIGLVIGLPVAYALSIVLQEGLGAAMVVDARTFVIFTLLLTSVAAGSSLVPACRATRVDPMTALREE